MCTYTEPQAVRHKPYHPIMYIISKKNKQRAGFAPSGPAPEILFGNLKTIIRMGGPKFFVELKKVYGPVFKVNSFELL